MWRQKNRLSEHLRSHNEMSDADFVQHIGASVDLAAYALMVREAVGEWYKIPHLYIHPSDATEYLSTLGPWYTEGADEDVAVIDFFDDRLNVRLDEEEMWKFPRFIKGWRFFFWGEKGCGCSGDYCLSVAAYTQEMTKHR